MPFVNNIKNKIWKPIEYVELAKDLPMDSNVRNVMTEEKEYQQENLEKEEKESNIIL